MAKSAAAIADGVTCLVYVVALLLSVLYFLDYIDII